MTKRCSILLAVFAGVPLTLLAQKPAAPSANPLADSEKRIYGMLSGVIVAAAQKMPEENYSFKPAPEVRTFGQLVGHQADSAYYFCSQAAGEAPPVTGIEKGKTVKADLIAALKDAVAYCNKVYAAMTDVKGVETIKLMNLDMPKLTVLAANFAHTYEHYGNMATYMRIKGIVPPTSEKNETSGPK